MSIRLPAAAVRETVKAPRTGCVASIAVERVALALGTMGAIVVLLVLGFAALSTAPRGSAAT